MQNLNDFLTANLHVITLCTLVVAIVSTIIYKKQLSTAKVQTALLLGENEPKFIFAGSKNLDSIKNVYLFENLGKPVKDFNVYLTDNIFLSHSMTSGAHLFEESVGAFPMGIDFRINGRFDNSTPVSGATVQQISIKEDNENIDILLFEEEIKNEVDCQTIMWRRVIISYTDYKGARQESHYMLINNELLQEGSAAYIAYDFLRENTFDYDIRLQNKNTVIGIVKKKLDTLYDTYRI